MKRKEKKYVGKLTIVEDGTGCEITDDNWDEEMLGKFLMIGWKIKKEKIKND